MSSDADSVDDRFADLFDRVQEGLARGERFDPAALARDFRLERVMVEQCLEALDALSQFQEDPAPLPPNLGPYTLLQQLGAGGMGEVYQGRHQRDGSLAAIKIIRRSQASSPAFLERFHREAAALLSLRHPNIVSIYDVGQDGDWTYIAMEYIDGESLADYLARSGPLRPEIAARVLRAVANGLAHVHQFQWLHRDIKPQNILIERQGRVVLADFGIAKDLNRNTELTKTGEVLGTLAYLSPEQLRGEKIDQRADIYSLGATLYHMLFGKLPPRPGRLPSFNPQQTPWLVNICRRCLEDDRSRRFSTVEHLIAELGA